MTPPFWRAVGTDLLINNTGTMATDTFSDAILFEKLIS
jgi:hypothetical protein